MVASPKKDGSIVLSRLLTGVVVSALVLAGGVESFSPSSCTRSSSTTISPRSQQRQHFVPSSTIQKIGATGNCIGMTTPCVSSTLLAAKSSSGEGGKKKRRRKRKKAPAGKEVASSATTAVVVDGAAAAAPQSVAGDGVAQTIESVEVNDAEFKGVAGYSFKGAGGIEASPQADSAVGTSVSPPVSTVEKDDGSLPLPDIKDTMRRKRMEINLSPMEDSMPKKKIDRNDREALMKLLEQDPYADGDDSFFEEQEYTFISALLGERAKPFLGIPIAPLQVGHFIGALVIVLMAFIEYPGFPLTNLPSPIRGALQGGLGTIYGINILLAIVAGFKAGPRGQPPQLWIAKTFTVGGLALDQLTQLPTLEQIEVAKARKGKRALKNRKK